MKEMSGS